MEWKKVKTRIRKIFCAVLATAMLVTGVLSQTQTAQAEAYSWMATAETIRLGQTYSGLVELGKNGKDTDEYLYIYLPVNMNITLNVKEKGTKHFDWINIYNSNGQRIQFLWDGWNYSRNTAQSVCTKKMKLHKGGYYINLHEIYNCFYDEKKTKAFTVKITGTLTYATRITGARKLSRRNLKLAWKRIGGVRGYEVYRSTSLRGTYRRVKTVSGITCIDRNLTTNRNYYYKVRAYKIIGNKKYYTPFSGAKKIRM